MKNLIKFIFFMSILALNLSAENFDNLKKLQQLFTDVNFDKNAFFKGEQRRNLDINYAQNAKHYKVLVTRIGQSDDFNDIFRVSLQSEKPWRDALGTRYEWQDLYFYAKNDGIYAPFMHKENLHKQAFCEIYSIFVVRLIRNKNVNLISKI
jgi:hypothetical protein